MNSILASHHRGRLLSEYAGFEKFLLQIHIKNPKLYAFDVYNNIFYDLSILKLMHNKFKIEYPTPILLET